MPPRNRAAVLAAALALCPACKDRAATPAPTRTEAAAGRALDVSTPRAQARPRSPAEMKEALRALRDETVVEQGRYLTTAANLASYASSLRKYAREAEEVSLYRKVPLAPETGPLEAAVRGALEPLGFPVVVRAAARPNARRPLPATLPEGERFEPIPDDVRGVLDLRIELQGARAATLGAALGKLAGLARLVYAARAEVRATALHLDAEAYYFHEGFRPPVMQPRPRDLDATLRARGIEPGALAGDAEVQAWLDELTADFKAMQAKAGDYARALAVQGQLIGFDARMRFARDRAAAAAERSAEALLRDARAPAPR